MSFEMSFDKNVTGKWMVVEKETGWFYPNLTQLEAEHLCEKLNETNKKEIEVSRRIRTIPFSENQIHDDFIEWDDLITWLQKTGERLNEIDELYKEEFKVELKKAIEDKVDFKGIYGGNTEKTRKQYVDEQLGDLLDEKKLLKGYQADDLRRIEFLKRLIDYKLRMLDYKPAVELESVG